MTDRLRKFLAESGDPIERRALERRLLSRRQLDECILAKGEAGDLRSILAERGYRFGAHRRILWMAVPAAVGFVAVVGLVLRPAQADPRGQAYAALAWAREYRYAADADPGELARRAEAAQRAIERLPDSAESRCLLGQAWETRGCFVRAEECWRRALEIDPAHGPSHFELGRLLAARAFWRIRAGAETVAPLRAEAKAHLEAAPASEGAEALLAWLRDDAATVRRLASHATEDLLWTLGLATEGEERMTAFDRALEIRPVFPLVSCSRGFARSDPVQAERDFTGAIRFAPELADAYVERGIARMTRGDPRGAVADFETTLKLMPRDAPSRRRVKALLEKAKARYFFSWRALTRW